MTKHAINAQESKTSVGREVPKVYNSKSIFVADAGDAVLSPESSKGLANPENPSQKKRKGPLPFSINQNESLSKELSPVGGDTNSPTHCRKPLYPTVTSTSCKSRSGDEHESCKNLPCQCLQRSLGDMNVFSSPPVTLQTQLISVQMGSIISAVGQDVTESTGVVSPREKRRKN